MSQQRSIAIIGAGPAGLALALSLLRQGLQCTVYESRAQDAADKAPHAAVTLQPNGLKILDKLGLYSRLQQCGYSVDGMHIHDLSTGSSTIVDQGKEAAYGYKSLRIYRAVLVEELRKAVTAYKLEIQYERKFSHVIEESEDRVTFAFADGSRETANLLVGGDGIHSRLRAYIEPGQEPEYSGLVGLGAEVSSDVLQFSDKIGPDQMPMMVKRQQAMVNLVPQDADGSKVFIGRGKAMENRSEDDWRALESDRNSLVSFFKADAGDWEEPVRSALDNIDLETAYLWPVHTMPRLDHWVSKRKCVAILGDAAHAVSPITGQGVNQAFEDAYMLAAVLASSSQRTTNSEALTFWESQRMKRVYELIDRLVVKDQKKGTQMETKTRIAAKKDGNDPRGDAWLFRPGIDEAVEIWSTS